MANVKDFKTAIFNKLKTVDSLKYVYNYGRSKYDGYPCAIILYQGFDSEYADNARDLRTYTYDIQIIQERLEQNFGHEKGERVLQEAIDDIMTVLDADTDLSNSEIVYSDPFGNEREDRGEYLTATITVSAKALINTTI